ncbi:MAG: amylo-alpha-1,6-glucosidase [Candidatus Aquicultorales bacterium]
MREPYVAGDGEEFLPEEEGAPPREGIAFVAVDIREDWLPVKEGEHFLFTNSEGNIPERNPSGLGFYYLDTRFLSCYELLLDGRKPVLLSSTAERDYMGRIELTNGHLPGEKERAPQETISLRRLRVVKDGLHERIRLKNYNQFAVSVELALTFDADFADLFEVRGMERPTRGRYLVPKREGGLLVFGYVGEDEILMRTRIKLPRPPDGEETLRTRTTLRFVETIGPGDRVTLDFHIEPLVGEKLAEKPEMDEVVEALSESYERWTEGITVVRSDNELLNSVVERGISDLRALLVDDADGMIFHAGIPWYVAPFGRDSLISALEVLPIAPHVARGVLSFLASRQGREVNLWREEEPGKILHELRRGELARTNEIPHTPYYGTIDSTPLFLMLAAEHYRWTGDERFMRSIWDNLLSALRWLDEFGDKDGDGFVEYIKTSERGLANQGWKDSWNALAYRDGTLADPPIALCEVQGYTYAAKLGMAGMMEDMGDPDGAVRLRQEAGALKRRFNDAFWMADEGFIALALDGSKAHVGTVASNPGHCLWTGIVDEALAEQVVKRLLEPDMFSGWGVRTLSKRAPTYNPMSYHNGSVWPHDNAILIAGIKRYGHREAAVELASALFDTAVHHAYHRLPELFCGFTRLGTSAPVKYAAACSPQAWSVGSVFLMLQAVLGLQADVPNGVLYLDEPSLPPWVNRIEIGNLKLGDSAVGLRFVRDGGSTSVEETYRQGPVELRIGRAA